MNRIRELRKKKGLSQKQLGDMLGVSMHAVSKWEADLRNPEFENLDTLCSVLEASWEYLFCRSDINEYKPGQSDEERYGLPDEAFMPLTEEEHAEYLYELYKKADPKTRRAVELILGDDSKHPLSLDQQQDKP